jgi:hypothetical protein
MLVVVRAPLLSTNARSSTPLCDSVTGVVGMPLLIFHTGLGLCHTWAGLLANGLLPTVGD